MYGMYMAVNNVSLPYLLLPFSSLVGAGNRAFAYLKLEDFGFAIADATKALELDANYLKVRESLF